MSEIRDKYLWLVEKIHRDVQTNFNNDGHLVPVVFFITFKGKMGVMPARYTNAEEKELFINAVRHISTKEKAIGVIMATETWCSHGEDATKWYMEHGSLTDFPDRTEAIMIQEEYLDGNYNTLMDIVRKKGKKPTLKVRETEEVPNIAGRMTNLLNKPDVEKLLKGV